MKVIKYNLLLSKFFRFSLVFVLIAGWIFSGFPAIWPLGEFGVNTIRIPPEVQVGAGSTP